MDDSGRRILVIDDAPEYLGFMRSLLTAEGYTVSVAQTLDAARDGIATLRPGRDLIISDVRMPGAPPFAVLDMLDGDAERGTLPVLLCTGAIQEVDGAAERLLRRGTGVLLKPFDIDELLACIERLCHAASPV